MPGPFAHCPLLDGLDPPLLENLRSTLTDLVKTLSSNLHNLLKLLRWLQEAQSPPGRPLSDILGGQRLSIWLAYAATLSQRMENCFSDVIYTLFEMLQDEDKTWLNKRFQEYKHQSWHHELSHYKPILKEEIPFLLAFINYTPEMPPGTGVLEQSKRPDGGYHVISTSGSRNQPGVPSPVDGAVSAPSQPRPQVIKDLVITGMKKIDLTKELQNLQPPHFEESSNTAQGRALSSLGSLQSSFF